MAKFKEKNEAILLRKEGWSISDISKKVSVSKSTVSGWCKDIVLTEKAIQKIAKQSHRKSTGALLRYSERIRAQRQLNTQASEQLGKKRLGVLSERDIYCLGLGLYWGEGYKKGSQEFGFTNSDPKMIIFYITWLRVVFGVQKCDLILRVSINELHTSRMSEVERFWSHVTGVSSSQFTMSSLIKTNNKKIYQNDTHRGTLRIKVRKGTSLRREVLGAIANIVQ